MYDSIYIDYKLLFDRLSNCSLGNMTSLISIILILLSPIYSRMCYTKMQILNIPLHDKWQKICIFAQFLITCVRNDALRSATPYANPN